MKIGIFTDSHYSSAELTCGKRHNSKSLKKIEEAYAHFQAEKCDLVISLGDLIDREEEHITEIENLKKVAAVIRDSGIQTYCVMGNHDAFAFTSDEFYEILGHDRRPCRKHINGKTLLFLDTCYFKSGRHYEPGDSDWTDTCLPDPSALKKQLRESGGDAYIFMHQNIDPDVKENHRLSNDREVRKILEKSGIVKEVYQGHYHPGIISEHNGIRYTTFPAMCENDNARFIIEIS